LSFKLDPKFRDVFKEKSLFYFLWQADLPILKEGGLNLKGYDILGLKKAKKKLVKGLKTLDPITFYDRKKIYKKTALEFPELKGPLLTKKFYENQYHILSKKDLKQGALCAEIDRQINLKKKRVHFIDAVNFMYDVYQDSSFHFEYFLDFRTRVYSSGWPIGSTQGIFKYFLLSKNSETVQLPAQTALLDKIKLESFQKN
jgi:hypothetical protein